MILSKLLPLLLLATLTTKAFYRSNLGEEFINNGYVEIQDTSCDAKKFDDLYTSFDEMIDFLQAHPIWIQKLSQAKERFIRSKDKFLYSTDFFGLYDESGKDKRGQVSFYYSTHFHQYICSLYPEFNKIPQIAHFLEICSTIQEPYKEIFMQASDQLDLTIKHFPILLKIVKYLPSYDAKKPHYDGTAFSLFLNSTDNQSLLLCPYQSSYTTDDFICPVRKFDRDPHHKSIVLIPGALLTEFFIYPTPHIVRSHGSTRYATIAFAMRPNHIFQKPNLSELPKF